MNVVGIIAEYNPMHNGHVYNIKKAKELSNADYVIVIMSGSFTEQGNISVINKFEKAKIAIENGADMVIELPTIYAISSAENFAFGAVNILNSLGIITHLAFGAESNNICNLNEIANTYLIHKDEIINKTKEFSKQGINSGEAYSKALSEYINTSEDFTLPNNILAIEYIKALIALKSKIKPVLVHRYNSSHNDKEIENKGKYASSTSIRNVLFDKNLPKTEMLNKIYNSIPQNTYNYLQDNKLFSNEDMWSNLKYEIIKLNASGLKEIHEIAEGLENKIYKQALACDSYDQFIFRIKSKRYTLSKIKRICIYILLGITKEKYKKLKNVNYARVLKVKDSSIELLSALSNAATNLVITKITDDTFSSFNESIQESIKLDIFANNLYNSDNMDYMNKIIQPWKWQGCILLLFLCFHILT